MTETQRGVFQDEEAAAASCSGTVMATIGVVVGAGVVCLRIHFLILISTEMGCTPSVILGRVRKHLIAKELRRILADRSRERVRKVKRTRGLEIGEMERGFGGAWCLRFHGE